MAEPEGYRFSEEPELTGFAKLAYEAVENKWKQPQSGQLAAVEFAGWAKDHSRAEVDQMIGHVKEFAAAIGISWEQINERPKDNAERKKHEAISCFAMSVWRMRQLKDVQPRFLQAIDKVAELEGPTFDEEKVRHLASQMRQALEEVLALPSVETEIKTTTETASSPDPEGTVDNAVKEPLQ